MTGGTEGGVAVETGHQPVWLRWLIATNTRKFTATFSVTWLTVTTSLNSTSRASTGAAADASAVAVGAAVATGRAADVPPAPGRSHGLGGELPDMVVI